MKQLKYLMLFSSTLFLFQCKETPHTQSNSEPSTLNWRAISEKVIERMDPQHGERVLLIAQPGRFDSLILLLADQIKTKQAIYLGTISVDSVQPIGWETEFTTQAKRLDSAQLIEHFSYVDAGIMLPGAAPTHRPYAALQEVLKKGKGRTVHFHWSGAFDVNGTPLAMNDSIDLFYQRALLTTDYAALAKVQSQFEAAAQRKTVEVSTPEGTRLRFDITGRPMTKQDGDASQARSQKSITLIDREIELPAGAIRVAPLEETVEGVMVIPSSTWSNQPVTELTLKFAKGKVVSFRAASGEEAVAQELKTGGEAARSFRELALGFNTILTPQSGYTWVPHYGYGAGVVRLSLGDNTELNGKVRGKYVRWNFFVNATIKVGDEVWVESGKLAAQP